LAVTGNVTIDTSTLVADAANNRVGVGTATPKTKLNVVGGDVQLDSGQMLSFYTGATVGLQNNGVKGSDVDDSLRFITGAAERVIIKAGNVGIGLTAPINLLHVSKSDTTNTFPSTAAINISNSNGAAFGRTMGLNFSIGDGTIPEFLAGVYSVYTSYGTTVAGSLAFITNNGSGSFAERARITSDGYMRMASGTGGIQFNGDTAAANALDDYEEGTWTMGVSFGGASVGVTYNLNTGTYTKIGRQVTVNGLLILTSKGSSTGNAKVTGLPFTIGSATGNYCSASLRLSNVAFTNQFQGFGLVSSTTIDLEEVTILGAVTTLSNSDFTNDSAVMVSLTYFV
jgi:hypothetical protein